MINQIKKSNPLPRRWLWFSRFNLVALMILSGILYLWMMENPPLNVSNDFTKLSFLLAFISILFVINHTSIFPLSLGSIMLLSTLTSSTSTTTFTLMLAFSLIEVFIGFISAPLVHSYLARITSILESSTKVTSENSHDLNSSLKVTEKFPIILHETRATMLMGIFIGIGISFAFFMPPLMNFFNQNPIILIFRFILLLMTIFTIGIPLTVAIHHAPEPIIQKIRKNELPIDLRLWFSIFLIMGSFSFFASSMGALIINDGSKDILRLLQGDFFLLLVMIWGILFYTGVLTGWLKSIYLSEEALLNVPLLTIFAVLPLSRVIRLFIKPH